ncbi:hypothetical protein GCM10022258_26750 [Aquimarina gracilis]
MSLNLSGCYEVEKAVTEIKALQQIEITYDDYEVEIDQYDRSIYLDKKREFMTGHFYVVYNEKVSEEFVLKGGVLDGIHRVYSPEGHLLKEQHYKNGYLDGVSKFFNKEGKVTGITNYSKGKIVGDRIGYTNNGKMLTKTETINGIAYEHSYRENKLKMTMYSDKIDGVSYQILLHYDNVESLDGAFAVKDENTGTGQPSMFYILNEQYKIVDSISPKEQPEKMMEIYYFLQQ